MIDWLMYGRRFEWCIGGLILALLVSIVLLVIANVRAREHLTEMGCKITGHNTVWTTQYIYDGKGNITSLYIVPITQDIYTCPDGHSEVL